ncbi:PfkB-domain-containing protein [Xylona heveae TC161]|uniref:adenosine kinase n=1 Tax=Xylona heveae (strain CBS 132557 / TC161) TaxID=1328760 RepID=A0A165GSD5_XYLHT|nr:PfkB-domain-containing protein [Xylona heveae TC161]KZF22534.1 PfkB-domain-containing protein [Xylona heveae TC161]
MAMALGTGLRSFVGGAMSPPAAATAAAPLLQVRPQAHRALQSIQSQWHQSCQGQSEVVHSATRTFSSFSKSRALAARPFSSSPSSSTWMGSPTITTSAFAASTSTHNLRRVRQPHQSNNYSTTTSAPNISTPTTSLSLQQHRLLSSLHFARSWQGQVEKFNTSFSPLRRRSFSTSQNNKMSFQLFCLENPLLDIQGKGDEKLLEKYGLKANDAILAEEKHLGLYEELLTNHDAKLIAGGAAQNTARGAQYLLPPNSVVYAGSVGKDKYAQILHDAVKQVGLRVEYHVDETHPTGRCGVIITGHDRSMCTDLAAANCYKIEHLKSPEIWSLVEQAQVYYVGGYHLTVNVPAILALAEEAAQKNKTFVLSISAPFIPQFFKEQLDETAPYWDYVIGNETEALAYAESHSWGTTDLTEIAKKLALLPKRNTDKPRTVIITQGTDPTIVAIGSASGEPTVKTYPVHPINPEEICDTNGAGDAFAGGLLAGIVEGKTLEQSIDMGQWLASQSIRELGPSFPFPKKTYAPLQ